MKRKKDTCTRPDKNGVYICTDEEGLKYLASLMDEVTVSFRCSTPQCYKAKRKVRRKEFFANGPVVCRACGREYIVRVTVERTLVQRKP